jgi:hypothetical protein
MSSHILAYPLRSCVIMPAFAFLVLVVFRVSFGVGRVRCNSFASYLMREHPTSRVLRCWDERAQSAMCLFVVLCGEWVCCNSTVGYHGVCHLHFTVDHVTIPCRHTLLYMLPLSLSFVV